MPFVSAFWNVTATAKGQKSALGLNSIIKDDDGIYVKVPTHVNLKDVDNQEELSRDKATSNTFLNTRSNADTGVFHRAAKRFKIVRWAHDPSLRQHHEP